MTAPDDPAALFEQHRRYLTGVAYRMLGSVAEAEDAVQEAYLRWRATGDGVAAPRAYLTKIVVRLCLDQLKSARAARESYVGPWLPEPVLTAAAPAAGAAAPAPAPGELVEDLSLGLLLLLERLSPLERAAFLLHDVFEMDFDAVAEALDSSAAACRQLAARARQHVRGGRPRFRASADQCQALIGAFFAAAYAGDTAQLTTLLARDAVLVSDSGGKRAAARKPVRGADRVARFFAGTLAKARRTGADRGVRAHGATVNGRPALLVFGADGALARMVSIDVDGDGRIAAIYMVVNPDKLRPVAEGTIMW